MSKARIVAVTVLLLAAACVGLLAQSVSSMIVGTVTDPSDAVAPNIRLKLTELGSGVVFTAESNEVGLFRFLDLKPGVYSLQIAATGFKAYELGGINLASSETRDLGKIALQVGSVTEELKVTAAATPVQTASSERSALVDGNQVENVALKGRDVFGYMRLLTGVVDTNNSRDIANSSSMSGIQINGASSSAKNVTLDGVTSMDSGANGTTYVTPNLDAVGEIRVLANGYQAEYGRQAGGTISIITKQGTTEFHGTGTWNRRHEDMNANSFFNNRTLVQRPLYRIFVGSYSIGGPIYVPKLFNTGRQRMFFFVSEEFTHRLVPSTVARANLPTAAELGGDFSNSRNSVGNVITVTDPTTGKPAPGNKLPQSLIDPTGLAILSQFPKAGNYTDPTQPYSYNYMAQSAGYEHRRDDIVRLDFALSSKQYLYLRAARDRDDTLTPYTVGPGIGSYVNIHPGYVFAVHETAALSSTAVNEFTFGLGHDNYGFFRPEGYDSYLRTASRNPPTLSPIPSGAAYLNLLPNAVFAGGQAANPGFLAFSLITVPGNVPVPYRNAEDTYSAQDDISKLLGAHSLKAGVYVEYNSKEEPMFGSNYTGTFNFGSSTANPIDTGYGYANALAGIFQTYSQATARSFPDMRQWQIEGYVQDNWRVSRRLTLDYGVRWQHSGRQNEINNQTAAFVPSQYSAARAPRLYVPTSVSGASRAIDPVTGQVVPFAFAGTIIPGSGNVIDGMQRDLKDYIDYPFLGIAPRFGFALDVLGSGKMSVRGSAGIYYNRPVTNILYPLMGVPPVIYSQQVLDGHITDIPSLAASAALSPVTAAAPSGSQPYERSHQFNITVQRDIGFETVLDVGYVGNFDRHGPQTIQLNRIPYQAYANPANVFNNTEISADLLRTAFPGMSAIGQITDSLSSLNYHGLQASAQHRFAHHLQFGASYTYSKALGTQGWDPYTSQRARYYGPLGTDRRNVLAVNYSYELPNAKDLGIARYVVGGWTLSGITSFTSGAPLSPACSSVSPGVANSDPSLSGVTARCQVIGDPGAFQHSFYNNFNVGAFAMAPAGTFGNAGLNILYQPSWSNWDVTFAKKVQLGKDTRRVLRLRIEAYNVFNHTEFSTIDSTYQFSGTTNIHSTTGQYTATNNPRQMSTTLRFEF